MSGFTPYVARVNTSVPAARPIIGKTTKELLPTYNNIFLSRPVGLSTDLLDKPAALPYRYDSYIITARIGAGTFSVVYKANELGSEKLKAIKVAREGKSLTHEISILQLLKKEAPCVNLVRLDAAISSSRAFVADYYGQNIWDEYISKGKAMPFDKIKSLILQVMHAIDYLNQRGLLHLDIKAENIMTSDPNFRVVLVDLSNAEIHGTVLQQNQNHTIFARPFEGFAMPQETNATSDVWGLGVVVGELLMNNKDSVFAHQKTQDNEEGRAAVAFEINTQLGLPSKKHCMQASPYLQLINHVWQCLKPIAYVPLPPWPQRIKTSALTAGYAEPHIDLAISWLSTVFLHIDKRGDLALAKRNVALYFGAGAHPPAPASPQCKRDRDVIPPQRRRIKRLRP